MMDRITPKRVREIIEAYGAEPGRWPEAERDAALAAVRERPELASLLREAQELDGMLDGFAPPLPRTKAADLAGRIAAIPQPAPIRRAAALATAPWRQWFAWPKLAGLAVAGLIGFTVGWTGLDSHVTSWVAPGSTVAVATLDGADAIWEGDLSW